MCRLLGIVANRPTNFSFSLRESSHASLESLSVEHMSGWGVAFRENNGWAVRKSPLQASVDASFKQASIEAGGKLLIGHIRKASSGDPKLENTHPFEMQGWVFAHNGTISEKDKLFDMVSQDIRPAIKGDTDSERYFAVLLSALNKAGLKPGAVAEKVAKVIEATLLSQISKCKGSGLNFLLSDGLNMYAFRKGRPLFRLTRDGAVNLHTLQSEDVRVLLGEKSKIGEKAVLIASEKLTQGEDWTEIPESSLVWISSEPVIHSTHVAI